MTPFTTALRALYRKNLDRKATYFWIYFTICCTAKITRNSGVHCYNEIKQSLHFPCDTGTRLAQQKNCRFRMPDLSKKVIDLQSLVS